MGAFAPHANIVHMTTQLHESTSTIVEQADKGTYKILLITPGRGSSGIYSEEMLRTYGPEAFPKGSHSYIDHLAEGETRSTLKMIGVYEEDAYWDDELGGLVSDLKPFSHWKKFVEEVAPHAGFSISASGNGEMIDEGGQQVFRVDELLPDVMNSVDLVSYAGRGGRLVESLLSEALAHDSTHSESSAGTGKKEIENMATLDEIAVATAALTESVDKIVSAQEAAAAAEVTEEQIAEKVAEAVAAAVAATRKVAEADLSEKIAESLYAQIVSGNFEVDERLTELEAIRNEITESLKESMIPGFTGSFSKDQDGSKAHNFKIGQW